jgi:periplasmic protein TonB
VSLATDARSYRKDAAAHLYEQNQTRIYKGTLPPLLYAIGVLEVEIDRRGTVVSIDWKRAPNHAPEVMAEIEKTVQAASPFPAPSKLGRVVYTDTWLWDESGRFQLDTLTEGQR